MKVVKEVEHLSSKEWLSAGTDFPGEGSGDSYQCVQILDGKQ